MMIFREKEHRDSKKGNVLETKTTTVDLQISAQKFRKID